MNNKVLGKGTELYSYQLIGFNKAVLINTFLYKEYFFFIHLLISLFLIILNSSNHVPFFAIIFV